MSLVCAVGEHKGSAALTNPTLRPLPQPLDIALVLQDNEAAHDDGEEDESDSGANERGDERKESEGGKCAAGGVAPQGDGSKPREEQYKSDERRNAEN